MNLKTTLPLDAAQKIVARALATGRAENMLPLTVVVLDAGGRIVASNSEDGSGILRFEIALGKARAGLGMGLSSRAIRDRLSARPVFLGALAAASDGRFVPVPGGVLLQDAEGYTIGAVGISGDSSEKDEHACIEGARAAGLACDPAEPDPDWRGAPLSDK